jgi:two-component system, OmpR family, KDP operon response regulator KdpE
MKKILVADDDAPVRRALGLTLSAHAYRVVYAATGERALQATASERPDLVLLDLGLPGVTGLRLIEALRGWSTVPIIALTAQRDERLKVIALDAGADDYMTKPFGMAELLARMRAVMRRDLPAIEDCPEVTTPSIRLNLVARRAYVGLRLEREVHLTSTEWQIVEHLVCNEGRLITHRTLISAVWGSTSSPNPNLLRVHMANIRKKLEADPGTPRHFVTNNGLGYRFENDLAATAASGADVLSPATVRFSSRTASRGDDSSLRPSLQPVHLTRHAIQDGHCGRQRTDGSQ